MIRSVEIQGKAPQYATEGSGGVDLVANITELVHINPFETKLIPTGIKINLQTVTEDCVALIFPRSGAGAKEGKVLGNSVGVVDKDYQGEIMISLLNRNPDTYITIQPGDRIAQLVIVPIIRAEFIQVEEFSTTTKRGEGGFGHTGK